MNMVNFAKDKTVKYLALTVFVLAVLMLGQKLFLNKESAVLPEMPLALPNINLKISDIENINLTADGEVIPKQSAFEPITVPSRVGRSDPFAPYPLVDTEMPVATSTIAATTTSAIATTTQATSATTTATTTNPE